LAFAIKYSISAASKLKDLYTRPMNDKVQYSITHICSLVKDSVELIFRNRKLDLLTAIKLLGCTLWQFRH